jgi:ABC-type polysaccharide/polyol phosphate transport system ATPase subunit
MQTVIRFNQVSKKFTLHRERARSFQELLLSLSRKKDKGQMFWALQDVSLEVEQGETIGIIGPNGAGKSTILKLISRIIEPTSGQIEINGKVGALLELGAGFHPDLTGRENIYLNGSVLGLNRARLKQCIDEIIAFAELERFIDTAVKHYSSGMYVRLGFAIAAYTEPDILLVDEVLAVGDATFRRKCLERIRTLKDSGTTIVVVTHDLDLVRRNCSRAIWLQEGKIVSSSHPESLLQQYIEWSLEKKDLQSRQQGRRWGSGEIEINTVRTLDTTGQEKKMFCTGEPMQIEIQYRANERIACPVFGLAIHRSDGVHVTGPNTLADNTRIPEIIGEGSIYYTIASLPLLEGEYFISASVHNEQDTLMYNYHDRLYFFAVSKSSNPCYGLTTLNGHWVVEGIEPPNS